MDHFYLTLPSNSSEVFYGKQSMSNYKTHLAKELRLDVDEWEVGLAEIIYPHTWNNVTEGTFHIKVLDNEQWVWKDVKVPSASYETPSQLIEIINGLVQPLLSGNQKDKIRFYYHNLTRKVTVYVAEGYMVRLCKFLSKTLGFGDLVAHLRQSKNVDNFGVVEKEERIVYSNSKILAPFCLDLNRGLHTFFVYCDLVQYQLVGDAYVPLLRTVPVSGKSGDVLVRTFDNIHYVPLSRSTFQNVEIHITDDTGLQVPFQQGRVIVKLHFRRK